MSDHHYHANHTDAPARGSKTNAMKDARRLHVLNSIYADSGGWLVKPETTGDNIKAHGIEFPLIVKCRRQDCRLVPA